MAWLAAARADALSCASSSPISEESRSPTDSCSNWKRGGRRGRAVLGLRDGAGEPLQLLGTGGVPGPRRLRLAREPDEALPAVGDRLGGGGELVLRGLERALRTGPILDGLPLHVLGGGQRLAELPLLRLGALCGRLERVRVLAGRRLPRRVGEVPRPLLGQRDRAAEAFGQRR